MPHTIYKEEQRFQRSYILMLAALLIGAIASILYQTWFTGETVLPLYIELTSVAAVIALLIYMVRSRLVMKISPRKIKLKRYPALGNAKSKIKLKEVEECLELKTSMGAVLSGWDVRFGEVDTVHKICGQKGVALKLKNGETVFIESKKPEELKKLIDELKGGLAA